MTADPADRDREVLEDCTEALVDHLHALSDTAQVLPPRLLDRARRARLSRCRMPVYRLDLPEPPTMQSHVNWRSRAGQVRKVKQAVWASACSCVRPFREPPGRVRLHAHFRLWNRRDPWNLPGNLKPVIDALQQTSTAVDPEDWRGGLFEGRGYLIDDADAEVGVITQEIDRDDRGLTLWVEVTDPDFEAPDR